MSKLLFHSLENGTLSTLKARCLPSSTLLASTVLSYAYLLRKVKLDLCKCISVSGSFSTTATDEAMGCSSLAPFPVASPRIGLVNRHESRFCLLAVCVTWGSMVPAGLGLPSQRL